MDMMIGPGVVLSLLVVTAGVTLAFYLRSRHLEKMAMIERGLIEEGNLLANNYLEVKLGMMMLGVGVGLMVGLGFDKVTHFREGEVFYPAFMLLFGGVSLLASYFVIRQLQARD